MKKKVLWFLSVLLIAAFVLAACGGGAEAPAAEEPAEEEPAEEGAYQIPTVEEGMYNVAFVYVGPHDDGGWSQAHDVGRMWVEENVENVHTAYVENVAEGADAEQVIRSLARKGFDVIFTTSFGFMDASEVVAEEFPDVDIIHMHAFGPAMFGLIPRLFGRRVVTQGHGLEWKRSKWNWWGRFFLKATEKPSVWAAHHLTAVSKVQQKYLSETYGRPCTYLPTGVNKPVFEEPELIVNDYGLNGDDYILFAARLVREKGAHFLIEAYRQSGSSLKLVIAGDAQHEEEYKDELKELAGEDVNIIFTGFVTGKLLHELYSNCYCFVLPSEVEGLPTALLEAMSYGRCVICSDIPENLEALQWFGFTFSSKNPKDLAKRIQFLERNRHEALKFGSRAREHVLKYHSWDDIAKGFEKFYQEASEND